ELDETVRPVENAADVGVRVGRVEEGEPFLDTTEAFRRIVLGKDHRFLEERFGLAVVIPHEPVDFARFAGGLPCHLKLSEIIEKSGLNPKEPSLFHGIGARVSQVVRLFQIGKGSAVVCVPSKNRGEGGELAEAEIGKEPCAVDSLAQVLVHGDREEDQLLGLAAIALGEVGIGPLKKVESEPILLVAPVLPHRGEALFLRKAGQAGEADFALLQLVPDEVGDLEEVRKSLEEERPLVDLLGKERIEAKLVRDRGRLHPAALAGGEKVPYHPGAQGRSGAEREEGSQV